MNKKCISECKESKNLMHSANSLISYANLIKKQQKINLFFHLLQQNMKQIPRKENKGHIRMLCGFKPESQGEV